MTGIISVTKTDINDCCAQGRKLKWSEKRIYTTLHYLGFEDIKIAIALKEDLT